MGHAAKPVKALGDGSPPLKTWAREGGTPRAATPLKRVEPIDRISNSSFELSDGRCTPPAAAEAPPENAPAVRKSGRQQQVPGRLKALNGEDDKLAHAKRRKRRKKMDPHEG